MTTPHLSIVISAYNEAQNLDRGTLDEVVKYLSSQPKIWEIIIVNDGSTDNTSELLHAYAKKNTQVEIIDNPHQGKAIGIITGTLAARGKLVLFTDMDQATPI